MPAGQCVRTDWPEIPLDAQIDSSWSRDHSQARMVRQYEAHHSLPEPKFTVTGCSRLPHSAQRACAQGADCLRFSAGDLYNFFGDIFRRQDKIDAPARDCALRHVRLTRRTRLLGDGNPPYFLDTAQCRSPVAVIA